MKRTIFYLLLFTSICSDVIALNILAVVSLPLKSHYMAYSGIFKELAVRGHNVTVLNNFPENPPPPGMKFIQIEQFIYSESDKLPALEVYESIPSYLVPFYSLRRQHRVYNKITKLCENLFADEVSESVGDSKFDVIFAELFLSDCDLVYAAAFHDAPIIGLGSNHMLPWNYPKLGIPFDVAADQFQYLNTGPNPSFLGKLEVYLVRFYFNFIFKYHLQNNIYEILSKHLPNNHLDIDDMARHRIKMMFSYQHFSLSGARLTCPQVLEIGGIHIGEVKPVSNDIEKFLGNATHGAVYVSFGSNLRVDSMSKNKLEQFLTAFNNTPYKVLWKWENGSLPAEYKNIYTSSWFSQLDVLCHPKVKAFVSHGGMLSISEAAHCATPVLVIPIFGDQFSNAAAVRSVGLGKTLFLDRLNAQNLEESLRELMLDEMQQNAQRVSRQWHDRPQSAMDSAIYWTEYVARHRSAPPSLPSKNNTWFQSLLIDVYIALFAIFSLIGLFFYAIFKLIKFLLLKLFKNRCALRFCLRRSNFTGDTRDFFKIKIV